MYADKANLYLDDPRLYSFVDATNPSELKIKGVKPDESVERILLVPRAGLWRATFSLVWDGGSLSFKSCFSWDGSTRPAFTPDPSVAVLPSLPEQSTRSLAEVLGIPPRPEPLAESEVRLEWSQHSSSSRLLFYVWNQTPNTVICEIVLRSVQRWSEQQGTFIDDSAVGLYDFEILRTLVEPENKTAHELIRTEGDGFAVLGRRREQTYYRTTKCAWRLHFSIALGNKRSRNQYLDFQWGDAGLSSLT